MNSPLVWQVSQRTLWCCALSAKPVALWSKSAPVCWACTSCNAASCNSNKANMPQPNRTHFCMYFFIMVESPALCDS